MKVYLPQPKLVTNSWWYVGNRNRQATATAVRFVGDDLLVAHYLGRKLYLLDQRENVLLELNTRFETDLLDIKGSLVACTNLFEKKISLFHLNDTLSFYKYLNVPYGHLHGVFIDGDSVICTTDNSLVRVDFNSKCTVIKTFEDQPKDVFVYGPYIVVVSTKGLVKAKSVNMPTKATTLHLIKDNQVIDSISFTGRADALAFKQETPYTIYVTLQDIDSVAEIILEDEKLSFKRYIQEFNFPHGVDYSNGKLAVSNYGDNSISILNV